jgi:hypothetical protein
VKKKETERNCCVERRRAKSTVRTSMNEASAPLRRERCVKKREREKKELKGSSNERTHTQRRRKMRAGLSKQVNKIEPATSILFSRTRIWKCFDAKQNGLRAAEKEDLYAWIRNFFCSFVDSL